MEKERVELSLHTKMSDAFAVAAANDYIQWAAAQGQSAIAITDRGGIHAFPQAMRAAEQCRRAGHSIKIIYGMEAYYADGADTPMYHMTILVRNKVGLQNLYRLVTRSHLYHYSRGMPLVTKAELQKCRQSLLLGSGCGNGKLFSAAAQGEKNLSAIARAYDFLEIQPVWNCESVVPNEEKIQEELQRINRIIVQLGDDLGIPVCATGNAHYLKPEEEQARRILKDSFRAKDSFRGSPHMRSTQEMLRNFSYLGEKKAYEVVVKNTNLIAQRTKELRPVPTEHTWSRPGDERHLFSQCQGKAAEYDGPLAELIAERLAQESAVVKKQRSASSYRIASIIAHDLYAKCGVPVMTRMSAAASLLSYFSGISRVNPLPPHYRCPHCQHTELAQEGGVESGFDLPEKACPVCGRSMERDGQNIPWQDFLGQNGEKLPDFAFNITGDFFSQGRMMRVFAELFGENRVVYAGAVHAISERIARHYVREYEEKQGKPFAEEERTNRIQCLTGVKYDIVQDVGHYVLLPREIDSEKSIPLQYALNDPGTGICTHFDFSDLKNVFLHLGCMGDSTSALLVQLRRESGRDISCVDRFEQAVYDSLLAPPAFAAKAEQRFSYVEKLVLNGLSDEELRNSLPRNFTGIRKAISYLKNGTVSESAPGYCKGYMVELALAAVELEWYKLHFPEEFERACQCVFEDFEKKAVYQ